ncbi:MAG: hypothetical protein Q9174_004108 [Haloplaca sp. 1 TL-2023]
MAASVARRATNIRDLDHFELQTFQWYHVEKMSVRKMTEAFQILFDQIAMGPLPMTVTYNQWRGRLDKWKEHWGTDKLPRGEEVETRPKHLGALKLYYKHGHAQLDGLSCMEDCVRPIDLPHSVVPYQGQATGLHSPYEVSRPSMAENALAYDQQRYQSLLGGETVSIWTPYSRRPTAEYLPSLAPALQYSLQPSSFAPDNSTTYRPTALETPFDSTTAFAYPQMLGTTGHGRVPTMTGDYASTPAADSSASHYCNGSGRSIMALESLDPSLDGFNVPSTTGPTETDSDFEPYS